MAFLRLLASSVVQAATTGNPTEKASEKGDWTQRQQGGRVQLPRPSCLTGCPWQPRLHSRLHSRSINKGGQLRPTDSKVNADRKGGCKGTAKSGAIQCGANGSVHLTNPTQCSSSQSYSALALMPGYQAKPYSFVCLCKEVGNTLQEIPYNFTGNETKQKGGFCSH